MKLTTNGGHNLLKGPKECFSVVAEDKTRTSCCPLWEGKGERSGGWRDREREREREREKERESQSQSQRERERAKEDARIECERQRESEKKRCMHT